MSIIAIYLVKSLHFYHGIKAHLYNRLSASQ